MKIANPGIIWQYQNVAYQEDQTFLSALLTRSAENITLGQEKLPRTKTYSSVPVQSIRITKQPSLSLKHSGLLSYYILYNCITQFCPDKVCIYSRYSILIQLIGTSHLMFLFEMFCLLLLVSHYSQLNKGKGRTVVIASCAQFLFWWEMCGRK